MNKPLFITFEGGEGSGKTTQIKLLQQYLLSKNIDCITTREPGGCENAESIRNLLLSGAGDKWNAISETLLFQAARIEHIEKVIKPALLSKKIVLCDRFLDSTIVYQGIGKGLGGEYIKQLYQMTVGNFTPDLTFI
jgi:dTMP kinase